MIEVPLPKAGNLVEIDNGLGFFTQGASYPPDAGAGRGGYLRWAVIGPGGAVQLMALAMPQDFTPLHEDLFVRGTDGLWLLPADLSWHHADLAGAEGQDCDLVLFGSCRLEASALRAATPLRRWSEVGHDEGLLQAFLVAEYGETFSR